MNPLPRSIAMALFVVLAALVALLAVPLWPGLSGGDDAGGARIGAASPAAPGSAAAPAPQARAFLISHRAALMLAALSLLLSVALLLLLRSGRLAEAREPIAATQREMGTLARLAESSVAQGQELSRERDVRRLAEEDARLKQQLLAQSFDEKIRLGRDLHDGIIQSLYAAGLTLESVRTLLKSQPEEADRRLEQIRASLNEAIRDVRAYIAGLTPEKLRRASFGHALGALISELGAGRAAQFDIQIDDAAAALLSPEQSIEALQIAREAVSNALRHGGATVITLRMHKSEAEVGLLIQDNGRGFDAAQSRDGGHGLGNMHARAQRIGASLRISSQPGEGTRVFTAVPILQPATV